MADPLLSKSTAYALIYATLGFFFIVGLYAGRRSRKNLDLFIKSLYTQSLGSLSLNFLAVNAGSSLFITLPEVGTIAGVFGVAVYAISCAIPILIFGIIGPIFREHNPQNWSMSSFIIKRFGHGLNVVYCIIAIFYMFLYLVGEVATLYRVLQILTDINPLIPTIVLCAITTIYSAFGGVLASLFTDAIQTILLTVLIGVALIAIGTRVKIPSGAIDSIGLLKPTKLGYELIYIFIVALITSSMFHQGFWQRAFSSKDTRTLRNSTYIGAFMVFIIFGTVGMFGPIAAWAGVWTEELGAEGASPFFCLLSIMPKWVIAVILVVVICLSCAAMDTLSVSVAGNIFDLFNEKISFITIRLIIIVLIIPIVVLATRSPDILAIYLLADLLAAATVIPMLMGLLRAFRKITQIDALVGGVAGLLSIGVFGTIYLGNARDGWHLILLPDGLYSTDERVLGVFLVAPISSVIFTFISYGIRYFFYRAKGKEMPAYTIGMHEEAAQHQNKHAESL